MGLEELYRRYSGWLHDRLRSRYGAEIAGDIVQDAYLRIVPLPVEEIRSPKAFLLKIASNIALDRLAYDGVRVQHRKRALADDVAPENGFEDLLLKEIIRSIPEKDREVFLLSRFGGLTHAQIAARLGVAVKTVEWRMGRALKHCDDYLRR